MSKPGASWFLDKTGPSHAPHEEIFISKMNAYMLVLLWHSYLYTGPGC
jgi:hypothetical protein